MQSDHTLERALAQFEALMHLRPTFLHHDSVLVSIDHAIGDVFEDQNYDEVSKYIIKIRELVDFVEKMNGRGVLSPEQLRPRGPLDPYYIPIPAERFLSHLAPNPFSSSADMSRFLAARLHRLQVHPPDPDPRGWRF